MLRFLMNKKKTGSCGQPIQNREKMLPIAAAAAVKKQDLPV